MESFSKLLWLELIGLDNTKEDLGTTEFLARMSVKPEIISLLLWNTELIHSHTDMRLSIKQSQKVNTGTMAKAGAEATIKSLHLHTILQLLPNPYQKG